MRPSGQEGYPAADTVFDAAVADLHAGCDAQRPLRPQVVFEDVPAPRRLAPHAAAIAATLRAAGAGPQEQAEIVNDALTPGAISQTRRVRVVARRKK